MPSSDASKLRATTAPPRPRPIRSRTPRPRRAAWCRAWTGGGALSGITPSSACDGGPSRASYLASTLSASLELVKEGVLEARQFEAFADLYLRSRLRLEADP